MKVWALASLVILEEGWWRVDGEVDHGPWISGSWTLLSCLLNSYRVDSEFHVAGHSLCGHTSLLYFHKYLSLTDWTGNQAKLGLV